MTITESTTETTTETFGLGDKVILKRPWEIDQGDHCSQYAEFAAIGQLMTIVGGSILNAQYEPTYMVDTGAEYGSRRVRAGCLERATFAPGDTVRFNKPGNAEQTGELEQCCPSSDGCDWLMVASENVVTTSGVWDEDLVGGRIIKVLPVTGVPYVEAAAEPEGPDLLSDRDRDIWMRTAPRRWVMWNRTQNRWNDLTEQYVVPAGQPDQPSEAYQPYRPATLADRIDRGLSVYESLNSEAPSDLRQLAVGDEVVFRFAWGSAPGREQQGRLYSSGPENSLWVRKEDGYEWPTDDTELAIRTGDNRGGGGIVDLRRVRTFTPITRTAVQIRNEPWVGDMLYSDGRFVIYTHLEGVVPPCGWNARTPGTQPGVVGSERVSVGPPIRLLNAREMWEEFRVSGYPTERSAEQPALENVQTYRPGDVVDFHFRGNTHRGVLQAADGSDFMTAVPMEGHSWGNGFVRLGLVTEDGTRMNSGIESVTLIIRPETVQEPAEVATPTQEEMLREQVRQLQRELEAARDLHRTDMARISDVLIEEAENRDWCSDYDEVVNGLNNRLTMPLRRRVRSYSVTYDVIYRITTEVECSDRDEAYQTAQDEHTLDLLDYSEPRFELYDVD